MYPPRLVHGILKAIRQQLQCDGEVQSLSTGPAPDTTPVINEEDEYWSKLPRSDEDISEPVIDSNTGMVLDTDMVREARREELNWAHRQGI